jgi:hypothetical protein
LHIQRRSEKFDEPQTRISSEIPKVPYLCAQFPEMGNSSENLSDIKGAESSKKLEIKHTGSFRKLEIKKSDSFKKKQEIK